MEWNGINIDKKHFVGKMKKGWSEKVKESKDFDKGEG